MEFDIVAFPVVRSLREQITLPDTSTAISDSSRLSAFDVQQERTKEPIFSLTTDLISANRHIGDMEDFRQLVILIVFKAFHDRV